MSNHSILPFEYNGVRLTVITDENGDPEFEVNALCELLQHSNPRKAVADHVNQEDVTKRYTLTSGGKQLKNFVKERGMWKLIMKSNAPNAEPVQDWIAGDVLPSIRKTGSYTATAAKETNLSKRYIDAATAFIRNAATDLKMAQSSVLGMYQKLEAKAGLTGLLPHYATDAPEGDASGSSEATMSLSELLKDRQIEISTVKFNRILESKGILEQRTRPSTSRGEAKFWSIKNLRFGKNLTSPNNPRETQPLWYPSKFNELLAIAFDHEGATA